jgi:hypothetical protein
MGIEASTKSLKLNPNMNREAFLRAYHSFCTQTKAITLPPTMPIFAGKPLDVYSLFFSVMQLGGFAQVQENRLWKYVLVMMGLPANITSAGNALKKHYASLLEPFEPEFNGRQKEWLQAGLVSRIYSFRTSNVAAEDSMASSAQMSPASRPDMDDRDEVGVSSTNIATPQPGPIAESSSTSLDFADGPELASAGSMSAEEAKEKKNDKKQRVYQPVTRTLDTDGGILVDYIKKLYRGSGEANSARLKLTKNDLGTYMCACNRYFFIFHCQAFINLGTVDLFRLTMQLSSRLTVDVYDAIRTLLILTYDSSVDLRIAQYPDLVRELFLLWKEALNVLMKPNSDGQHCNSKFWSYEELFELEEGLLINPLDSISIQLEHAIPNQDVLLPRTALALPSTNKSLRPFLSNSFAAAELAVAIGTIFRNLSQPNENAKYLAQWHAFCEVLILWSRFQPSNHRDLTTTINAMKPKSFKRKYSVHDRDNQVRVPNGKRQKVVDGKIHALSHDKSSKAQLLDNSLVSLDVDNIIDNLDVSDRHGTFLQHRKITFSILHNLSLYFMLNNVNDAEWVLRVLLNFMTSGDSMCQDPDVIGGSLPCNAVIQSEYSTYSWAGLDILMRLLVNVENRRLFSSIPLALLESLVTALLAEVPTGSSFRVQGNQDRGTDLSVRWYDMLSVETSLHCLCFLAESSSIVRQTIARRPHAMVLFTRLTTGMSWSNVPVYLRDPAFSQTQVYATGIRSLTETRSAFEREKMQEMSLGMAKLGGKIFLQLVKDPISRAALSEKRRSNPPMPGFQWGYHDRPNRGLQVDSTSTSIDEVLAIQGFCETNWKNDALSGLPVSCTDVEMTLLGMTINPRLPRDHAELVTSILYYLARDSKEEDRALDIQSGDMDASQGNEGQTVIT